MMIIAFFFASVLISDSNTVFAFIGEKVCIEEQVIDYDDDVWVLDSVYAAHYRIILPLYGAPPFEEIEFTIYHHYGLNSPVGRPDFSTQPYSILFISKDENGDFYLEKYMSFAVYPTSDGRWSTCGGLFFYPELLSQNVQFLDKVSFKIKYPGEIESFPDYDFTIVGQEAICERGVFVEDLLYMALQTTLKSWGYNSE